MKLIPLLLLVALPAHSVPGDLNKDGIVDLSDFFILAENFGKEGPVEDGCADDTPAQLPLILQGEGGTEITEAFALEAGLIVIRVEFPKAESMIAELINADSGDQVELLVAESSTEGEGPREISQGFRIEEAGIFRINVRLVDTPWKITIE